MTRPIAPHLGRLSGPPRPVPYDAIRLMLLDQVVVQHGAGTLDGSAWLESWRATVDELTARVVEEGDAALVRAAVRSRYPAARLALLRPDGEFADALKNRLLAEGMPLERLDDLATDASTERSRGAALEMAWEGAVQEATLERGRLLAAAEQVAGWRRPLRPLLGAFAMVLLVVLVVAGLLGGWIPAPSWFAPVNTWFWSLPWP